MLDPGAGRVVVRPVRPAVALRWRATPIARFRGWIDESAEAILTVEFEGDELELDRRQAASAERDRRPDRDCWSPSRSATVKRAECDRLLGLRRLVEPLLDAVSRPGAAGLDRRRRGGAAGQLAAVLAAASEPASAAERHLDARRLRRDGTAAAAAVPRPFRPRRSGQARAAGRGVYDIVLEAGGTIGGSQACGLARTQFLRKQYGELSQVFREIKDAFDPLGQLNPGKVIGDDPHLMLRDLKPWPASPDEPRRSRRAHPTPISWGSGEIRTRNRSPRAGRRARRSGDRRTARPRAGSTDRVDRAGLALARPVDDRDGIELPGLRHLPVARPDGADVPELPRPAARGGVAAVAGKPGPRRRHRPGRPAALGRR